MRRYKATRPRYDRQYFRHYLGILSTPHCCAVGRVVGTHGDMPVLCYATPWYFRTVTRNILIWLSQKRRHALTEPDRWPSNNISIKCFNAQSLLGWVGRRLLLSEHKRNGHKSVKTPSDTTSFQSYKAKNFQTFIWGNMINKSIWMTLNVIRYLPYGHKLCYSMLRWTLIAPNELLVLRLT